MWQCDTLKTVNATYNIGSKCKISLDSQNQIESFLKHSLREMSSDHQSCVKFCAGPIKIIKIPDKLSYKFLVDVILSQKMP